MRVVIAGGGKVGSAIAVRLLADTDAQVTIIEADSETIARGTDMPNMTRNHGDATELGALEHAGVRDADVLVAATDGDEANLVVSLLAKMEFGVPRVIARINHPDNEWLFTESWGVDAAVSHAGLISAFVEESVSVGSLVRLLSLQHGHVRVLEVRLAEDSPAVGKELAELELPRDVTIIAVVRDEHITHPRPDTVFEPEDEVMALTAEDVEADVHRIFVGTDHSGS